LLSVVVKHFGSEVVDGKIPYAMTRATAHRLIDSGFVLVDGEVCKAAAMAVTNEQLVEVVEAFGEHVQPCRVWAFHKPVGVDCALVHSNPSSLLHTLASLNLMASCDIGSVFPVGRLDKDSQGLLVLTNSGVLCERLLHPSMEHEKEYLVTVSWPAPLPDSFFELMRSGVEWESSGNTEKSDPCRVIPCKPDGSPGPNPLMESDEGDVGALSKAERRSLALARRACFRITLCQGKNRQIRRMVHAAGSKIEPEVRAKVPRTPSEKRFADEQRGALCVVRLERIRVGPLHLPPTSELAEGAAVELTGLALSTFLRWAFV
jgi:pseudouridine synthase